jgi:hypothetical protein
MSGARDIKKADEGEIGTDLILGLGTLIVSSVAMSLSIQSMVGML